MQQIIRYNGIGNIVLVKSRRAKHLRITIKPDASVRVTIPASLEYSDGMAFVKNKEQWIRKSLGKMQARQIIPKLVFPGKSRLTETYELYLEKSDEPKLKGIIQNDALIISVPKGYSVSDPEVSAFIRFMSDKVLKAEAAAFLPRRVHELAEQFGFRYGRISLRSMKSRWGSCSSVNNISLNIHLMRLPAYLRDYVILHELVHTRVKNHGPAFWDMLDLFTGNRAKKLQKEMRQYTSSII